MDGISILLKTVGRNIKNARKGLDMSQYQLQDKCGVSRATISKIENGKSIELDNLLKIAQTLGIEPDILFLPPEKLSDYNIKFRRFWDMFEDIHKK